MPLLARDLELIQTATFQPEFQIVSRKGPVDLAGYTAFSQWRASLIDPEVMADMTTANGGIVIDQERSTIQLLLTDSKRDQLLALPYSRLVYDLFLRSPTSRNYPLAQGKVIFKRSVSHV